MPQWNGPILTTPEPTLGILEQRKTWQTHNAMATCEKKYFSCRRRRIEIILFQRVETCLKLFHKYFPTRSMSMK